MGPPAQIGGHHRPYDSRDNSLPEPMPAAVAARSLMFVVWIAPWVMVHDGFQKVDSSKNGVPGGILAPRGVRR